MALIDNLFAYWKFDEASGNAVDVFASKTATDNNGIGSGSGVINTARTFNGSTQFFSLTAFSFAPTGATLSVWFNIAALSSGHSGMILGRSSSSASYVYFVDTTHVNVNPDVADLKTYTVPLVSLATWYHLAVTRGDGTNTTRVYLNGVESSSGGQTQAGALTIDQFGRYIDGVAGGSAPFFFNGSLDELAIWTRALSATEIGQVYNGGNGFAYPFTPAATTSRIGRVPRNMASPVGRAQRRMGTPIGRAR